MLVDEEGHPICALAGLQLVSLPLAVGQGAGFV